MLPEIKLALEGVNDCTRSVSSIASMYSLPLLSRSSAGMEGERSLSSSSNKSEDHEYVWDGFTHGDQLVATSNNDYYEDLELAARLGKTLLQKNKQLDTMNYKLRCCNEEQSLEIEHLNKRLSWLREVNESKTRMFEQLDISYQDLEASNRKLKTQSREWKERLTKCMDVCENREEHIQTLKSEIESLRKMCEGRRAKDRIRRRTIHGCLPSAGKREDFQKFLEMSSEFGNSRREKEQKNSSSTDEEVRALHETIGNLKAQQNMDKRMVKELRKELESVLQENQEFCEKLQEEREMTQRLNRIIEEYDKVIYRQAFVAESTPNITVELTNNEIDFSDHSGDEDYMLGTPQGVSMASRLGQANKSFFQSPGTQVRTTMSQYLQIANSTPLRSPISSQASENYPNAVQDVSSCQGVASTKLRPPLHDGAPSHDGFKSQPKNVSLVQELDTQYKTLLGKYETLLQSIESEKAGSPAAETRRESSEGCENASSSFLTESPMVSDVENAVSSRSAGTNYVPKYKELFRELFKMINEAKA